MIKITDMHGNDVKGACRFSLAGFVVSVSTVWPTASDRVMVFEKEKEVFSCFTVEEAVDWVQAHS